MTFRSSIRDGGVDKNGVDAGPKFCVGLIVSNGEQGVRAKHVRGSQSVRVQLAANATSRLLQCAVATHRCAPHLFVLSMLRSPSLPTVTVQRVSQN